MKLLGAFWSEWLNSLKRIRNLCSINLLSKRRWRRISPWARAFSTGGTWCCSACMRSARISYTSTYRHCTTKTASSTSTSNHIPKSDSSSRSQEITKKCSSKTKNQPPKSSDRAVYPMGHLPSTSTVGRTKSLKTWRKPLRTGTKYLWFHSVWSATSPVGTDSCWATPCLSTRCVGL